MTQAAGTPAAYDHLVAVYNAMAKQATPDEETGELRVYEGHLTGLFRRLKLSTPYYTTIKNRLVAMGCIEQLKRGGGAAMSRWILWKEPTIEGYLAASTRKSRTSSDRVSSLEQRIRDLQRQQVVQGADIDELRRMIGVVQGVVEEKVGHNL